MNELVNQLRQAERVKGLNARLAQAMVYCPALVEEGWTFRCVEFHCGPGTYPTGHAAPWHLHHEYQIEAALAGEFEFKARGGSRVRLGPGQALVIPAELPHRWRCVRRGAMFGISLTLTPTQESIRRDGVLVSGFKRVHSPLIRRRVQELVQDGLRRLPNPPTSLVLACQMFLVLVAIIERVKFLVRSSARLPERTLAEVRGEQLVGRIIQEMAESPGRRITLAQMARQTGVSARQLHRLFLKHAGRSLHACLTEKRLELARVMLQERGASVRIKEVAFDCGFSSPNYFSSLFRRVYGYAPSEQILGGGAMKSGSTIQMLSVRRASFGPPASKNPA